MNPGVYTDLPESVYHKSEGVSKSSLDFMDRSPAHYQWNKMYPKKETKDMAFGTLLHTMLLQPDELKGMLAVGPDCERRANEDKQRWVDFWQSSEGKVRLDKHGRVLSMSTDGKISADTFLTKSKAEYMCEAVLNNKQAKEILDERIATEESIYTIHKPTDILMRGRIDIRTGNMLADLKSCQDASPEAFAKSVDSYKYYKQAPHYKHIASRETGIEYDIFQFICVEKSPPHGVGIYTIDRTWELKGSSMIYNNLKTLKHCQDNNVWPSYGSGTLTEEGKLI